MNLASDPDPREGVVSVVEDVFDTELHGLDPDVSLRNLPGWDSISHLRLVLELEQRFTIAIPDEEAASLATLGDLVRVVLDRTAG